MNIKGAKAILVLQGVKVLLSGLHLQKSYSNLFYIGANLRTLKSIIGCPWQPLVDPSNHSFNQ